MRDRIAPTRFPESDGRVSRNRGSSCCSRPTARRPRGSSTGRTPRSAAACSGRPRTPNDIRRLRVGRRETRLPVVERVRTGRTCGEVRRRDAVLRRAIGVDPAGVRTRRVKERSCGVAVSVYVLGTCRRRLTRRQQLRQHLVRRRVDAGIVGRHVRVELVGRGCRVGKLVGKVIVADCRIDQDLIVGAELIGKREVLELRFDRVVRAARVAAPETIPLCSSPGGRSARGAIARRAAGSGAGPRGIHDAIAAVRFGAD